MEDEGERVNLTDEMRKDSAGFADGMGGHKPRNAGAFKSLKRQGNRSPLEPPERSCQHLDLGPARPSSDFWPQALQDGKLVWY